MVDYFEDAKSLCDRAQHHFDEFQHLIGPNGTPPLWEIKEYNDGTDDRFTYVLQLNRNILIKAKPIVADSANNLIHALDQLVSAAARLCGNGRHRSLYFPWKPIEMEFERELRKLERLIGTDAVSAILATHERHKGAFPSIHAIKDISNSGKHWALTPSTSSARAISVRVPGQDVKVWEIPPNAFAETNSYKFAEGMQQVQSAPFSILITLKLEGLRETVPSSPDIIFNYAFRYVRDMIEAMHAVRG